MTVALAEHHQRARVERRLGRVALGSLAHVPLRYVGRRPRRRWEGAMVPVKPIAVLLLGAVTAGS
jgi:hypothetical protein